MFPVDPYPTFTVDNVELSLPGQAEPVLVSLTFAHLDQRARDQFDVDFKDRPIREALTHVLHGWGGFSKPFSAEARETVFDNYPVTVAEMWRTYREEMTQSKRKN